MTGAVSFHAGFCAEDQVAAEYARRGHEIVARRWRGQGGEIDLIVRDGAGLIFVEVKASGSHARAAERITPRQRDRIFCAASEFVAGAPGGLNTDMRFDVALLDRVGTIRIHENAFL